MYKEYPCEHKASRQIHWHYDKTRIYTVKVGYLLFLNNLINEESSSENLMAKTWKIMWKLRIPDKIKHFLWRATNNFLPTRIMLQINGLEIIPYCPLCKEEPKNVDHIPFSCSRAVEIYILISSYPLILTKVLLIDGSNFVHLAVERILN